MHCIPVPLQLIAIKSGPKEAWEKRPQQYLSFCHNMSWWVQILLCIVAVTRQCSPVNLLCLVSCCVNYRSQTSHHPRGSLFDTLERVATWSHIHLRVLHEGLARHSYGTAMHLRIQKPLMRFKSLTAALSHTLSNFQRTNKTIRLTGYNAVCDDPHHLPLPSIAELSVSLFHPGGHAHRNNDHDWELFRFLSFSKSPRLVVPSRSHFEPSIWHIIFPYLPFGIHNFPEFLSFCVSFLTLPAVFWRKTLAAPRSNPPKAIRRTFRPLLWLHEIRALLSLERLDEGLQFPGWPQFEATVPHGFLKLRPGGGGPLVNV